MKITGVLFYAFSSSVILFNSGDGLSYICNIIFLILFYKMFADICINNKKMIITYSVKSMLSLVGIGIVSAMFMQGEKALDGIYSLTGLSLLLLTADNVKDYIKKDVLINSVIIATIILSLWSLLSSSDTGERLGQGTVLINNFAMRVSVVSLLILDRLIKKGGFSNTISFIIAIIVLCMTESRSAIIISVILYCVMFFFTKKNSRIIKTILPFALLLISFYVGISNGLLGNYFKRFEVIQNQYEYYSNTNKIKGSVGVRLHLKEIGFESFLEKPLLGHGIGTTRSFLRDTHFHDNYIQLLYELGILGLLFYLFPILCTLIKSIKKEDVLAASLCLFILLYGLFAITYNNKFFYIVYFIAFWGFNENQYEKS